MLLNKLRVRILEDFTKGRYKELIGSQIANQKRLNQKSVSNVLLELESDGILRSRVEGKNKLYRLNLENKEELLNFMSAVEHLRTLQFYQKFPLIKETIGKILYYCDGLVIVFGSYAKDKAKADSDLDILIVGKYQQNKVNKIGDIYGININVKSYPLALFRKSLKSQDLFIDEVVKNHVMVQGVEKFVRLLYEKN